MSRRSHVLAASGAAITMGTLMVACPRVEHATLQAAPTMAASASPATSNPASRVHADTPSVVPVSPQDAPQGTPNATIDLGSTEGATLTKSQWKYSDVKIVEVDAKGPGADLKPSGRKTRTYDYLPKAGGAGFDDSKWESIAPTSLEDRRSTGKMCFAWYRTKVTIPDRIGDFDPTGSTVAFEIVIDDYAEVWVDGELPRRLGSTGGQVVKGFNAPNRVILTRDAKPGQTIQLAVFGMNGPISASPDNFIWIKSATLDFYRTPRARDMRDSLGFLERLDPAVDDLVAPDTRVEKLATGFLFTEGPVWSRDESSLLFSDPNDNVIYRYVADGALSVFRPHSGYKGFDVGSYHQPGSNGLTLDKQGRLTINEHGNRRVTRLEKNGVLTVLADRYDGKRLNSPNDLVYKSDGALYFTDPPFGLPKTFEDPKKELPYSGVFRVADGKVTLLTTDLTGPNGIAFSPDERFLYVDDWDDKKKVIMRYPVKDDGTLGTGEVLIDMGGAPEPEALDGMKVDQRGNIYVSGPGGLWIVSSIGKHVGTLRLAEQPANMAWGDDDAKSLYITARTSLYRVRVGVAGIRP